jgi:predicted N-acetyltransferase YhbS
VPHNRAVDEVGVRAYGGPDDLRTMQRAVQSAWTVDSRWQVGDLAWQGPSMADRTVALWGRDAWAWIGSGLALHAPRERFDSILDWYDDHARGTRQTVTAMSTDADLIDALHAVGYRRVEAPFFRHCLRDLDDRMPRPRLPDGYRVRAVRPGEIARRAAVHRAAWRPKRIGELAVPPVDLGDGESGMTAERYSRIAATWPYRPGLDLVAEAADGTLVASALGWLDEVNGVALLEPVGVDPAHARRGLGAAVSLACLRAMRDAGATLAKVCPRGDDAYPVPRALYHHIGFSDAARTVSFER